MIRRGQSTPAGCARLDNPHSDEKGRTTRPGNLRSQRGYCRVIKNQQLKLLNKIFTDRPAPFLAGLYSVQAVPDGVRPDITIFRDNAKDAAAWIKKRASQARRYKWYLLRHSSNAWDVYDASGKLVGVTKSVGKESASHDHRDVIDIDYDYFVEEGRKALGDRDTSCLIHVEGHRGAKAVDHSNFVVVCRRLVLEADTRDLKHFYMAESRQWPCRVLGLYANVSKLSARMQDAYLERVRHIKHSRPLIQEHHQEMLADRLVNSRAEYASTLIRQCALAAKMSEDLILGIMTAWSMTHDKNRYSLALHIVRTLYDGIELSSTEPETFDATTIATLGPKAIAAYEFYLK